MRVALVTLEERRIAAYARASTRDREQNPETQLRPLREHIAALREADFVGEFVDRASADDLRGRREWRRLLDLAMRRRVDIMVVWRLDRAFRRVVDGATTLEALRACGCGIRSLQEPWIDTTTAFGEALYHITIVWAILEKPRCERIPAGMERARAEGKRIGRQPRASAVNDHPQWTKIVRAVDAGYLTGGGGQEAAGPSHHASRRSQRRPQGGDDSCV